MPMLKSTSLSIYGIFTAVFGMLLDVAAFWKNRLINWCLSRSPKDTLLYRLDTAKTFEEWEVAAFQLDELMSTDLWRQNPTSKHYDYRLILGRLEAITGALEDGDIVTLVNLLRSGLVRNLGNITSHKLFRHAYAGTKLLIDDYITQVALSVQTVAGLETPLSESGLTSQAKLELLHDTRQAFGRSTLVLQGGAIFGLCHLGVVKALHLRGLLPRIITGTATGALIAALVGIHTEDELLTFLNGDGIDLTAFDRRGDALRERERGRNLYLGHESGWFGTLVRRVKRYIREGYFMDVNVLEECVRANVGNLTFEEAHERTKRVLNIALPTSGKGGFPNLLNYLTAPNVLIWSAALASNASLTTMYPPVQLYCKNEAGDIVPWSNSEEITSRSWRQPSYDDRESPLFRIAELFNVNHFIVSQARPYLVPFLQSDLQRPDQKQERWNLTLPLARLILLEIRHRLKQLDFLDLLPTSVRHLLVDENIPGPSLTLVPDLSPSDITKLFELPSKENLKYWILRGERSVWPAISALKVRCAIEVELDKGYQLVRRRPYDDASISTERRRRSSESMPRRQRSASFDQV